MTYILKNFSKFIVHIVHIVRLKQGLDLQGDDNRTVKLYRLDDAEMPLIPLVGIDGIFRKLFFYAK